MDSAYVRIITTLGHVDHGKTTLMDTLLAANNIISPRMAGKMRYLDSREDEQERGITMESSAVSLKFQVMETNAEGAKFPKTYVINMIDTPGHVDFSSEVSTASRLCDGALVLVDVVEGVCTQTIAVLRQAWHDRLRPILVINKMDRLVTELKLLPVEAYQHLARLIEQVNAIMGNFFASERMEDDLRWREERDRRLAEKKDAHADETDATVNEPEEFVEKDDEDIYFAPEKGNVVFASAIDGWGFRVGKFAQLFSQRLGIKEANLRRVLWGDFYLEPKTKKVISYKHLRGRSLKPLFVQFVLENIWAVYDAVTLNHNEDKIIKIVNNLGLKIPPRDMKSKDTRTLLSAIFSQWLPLSTSIIQAVIDVVPTPARAQAVRIPKMLYPELYHNTLQPTNKLETDLFASKSGHDACVVAYVSKMFAVSAKDLPENKKKPLTGEQLREKARLMKETSAEPKNSIVTSFTDQSNELKQPEMQDDVEILLGFSRLYSGTLRVGTSISAVLPKYDTSLDPELPNNARYLLSSKVENLYVMMGRELVPVTEVKAGNIFAIKGLQSKVWRSATLCSPGIAGIGDHPDLQQLKHCLVNLGSVNRSAAPIVRVALEPVKPADMQKMVDGLKILSQSDPCVETFQQETGEHVIFTAGELHLERCLKDLRERFAKVEIQASKPIVPFRETTVKAPDMPPTKLPNASRGTIRGSSSQNVVSFSIRACPLHIKIRQFILENVATLSTLQHDRKFQHVPLGDEDEQKADYGNIATKPAISPEHFWNGLVKNCKDAGGEWENVTDKIWAFGSRGAGTCLLIDARRPNPSRSSVNSAVEGPFSDTLTSLRRRLERLKSENDSQEIDKVIHEFDNYIETGFRHATSQGPLCAEPMDGVAFFVESVNVDKEAIEKELVQNLFSRITGSLITAVKDACRNGFLDWSPRLMLAMYSCEIQASTDVLGKVYAVVSKRRGRIIAEEMKEGTSFFSVCALLPVVESFGFADDIRTRTSGAASPQLIFSGFELLDLDPFWVPTTEEEIEDLGEKADRSNIAKGYMDAVRERKGMFVDRKIVEFAEKQRTLKR